ncbi:MAG: hypothetical protein QF467_01160 [SAR202 cluster bacterium]|nr:hypothetical protein [SAR202 cluster bacterium]
MSADALKFAAAMAGDASLLAWVWLVFARGMFWRTDLRLASGDGRHPDLPEVGVIVPAGSSALGSCMSGDFGIECTSKFGL